MLSASYHLDNHAACVRCLVGAAQYSFRRRAINPSLKDAPKDYEAYDSAVYLLFIQAAATQIW